MIFVVPPALVVATAVAWIGWIGKTAAPAIYHHRIQVQQQRYDAAKYLCDYKNDCSVLKAYAAKGLKVGPSIPSTISQPAQPVSKTLDQGDNTNGSDETKTLETYGNGKQSENGSDENSNK